MTNIQPTDVISLLQDFKIAESTHKFDDEYLNVNDADILKLIKDSEIHIITRLKIEFKDGQGYDDPQVDYAIKYRSAGLLFNKSLGDTTVDNQTNPSKYGDELINESEKIIDFMDTKVYSTSKR
jgi:hypothetical protein